jgi:hypothetical protein
MQTGFATYEFITYVVPGAIFVLCLMALFPRVKEFFGAERIDVGGLGLVLVAAFVLGELFNTIGTSVIGRYAIADKIDAVWEDKQEIIPERYKRDFVESVKNNFGVPVDQLKLKVRCRNDNDYRLWKSIVSRIRAILNLTKASDRVEIYLQQYIININIAAALLFCIVVVVPTFVVRTLVQPIEGVVMPEAFPPGRQSGDSGPPTAATASSEPAPIVSTKQNQILNWRYSPICLRLFIVAVLITALGVAVKRATDFERMFARELLLSFATAKVVAGKTP